MSNITIKGLVATTPRYLVTTDGTPILSFRIAEQTGDPVKEVNWYTITALGALATNANESIRKGNRIIANGELIIRNWDNGDRCGTSVEIEVNSMGHDLSWGTAEFTRINDRELEARATAEVL